MAIKILQPNNRSLGYGILHSEIGINVSRFSVKYFPEVDQTFGDYVGLTRFRVVSQFFSRTVECAGEISGTGGVMAFLLGSAVSFVNRVNDFGPVYGTFYLDEVTVSASRNGWKGLNLKATARPTL